MKSTLLLASFSACVSNCASYVSSNFVGQDISLDQPPVVKQGHCPSYVLKQISFRELIFYLQLMQLGPLIHLQLGWARFEHHLHLKLICL